METVVTNKKNSIRTVLLLSFAHLTNDVYTRFIASLTALLALSAVTASWVVAAFTISSSIAQPILGYFIDQKDQRWFIYVGTFWMSFFLGLTGYVNNFYVLFLLSAFAGIGTAAFHPQASSLVGNSTNSHKGLILSLFVTAGNIGGSISPLIFLNLFNVYGVKTTWLAVLPGIIVAVLLFIFLPRSKPRGKAPVPFLKLLVALRDPDIIKLILIVVFRSSVNAGLNYFLIKYFLQEGYTTFTTSLFITFTFFIGAIGGTIGGYTSDKYGRKPVIFISLFISSLALLGFLYTSGIISFVLLGLGGLTLLSSSSVTVASAQALIPDYKAMASGLTLGFASGIGGLLVPVFGYIASAYHDYTPALTVSFIVPLFGAVIALMLNAKKIQGKA